MRLLKRLFGKKESKPEPKPDKQVKEPSKPKETPKKTSTSSQKQPDKTQSTKPRKYHVTLNKNAKSDYVNMWRVRKEHSDKTIKHFKTQQEAIDFAVQLAKKDKTEIVIHKTDGTIRRQNY